MLSNLGLTALVLAFLVALYAVAAAAARASRGRTEWVESARRAAGLTFPLLTLAAACLVALLVAGRFEVEYVANVSSRAMPLYLRATALWGGQAGSILFWCWLMSAFAGAVMLRRWRRDRELLPAVIGVTMITLAFFAGLAVFVENPFARLWSLPALVGLAARNRRRYGGYVIHLGVVLMAIGIVGVELFQTETQASLAPGQSLTLGRYTLRFDSLAGFDLPDGRNVARAEVSVLEGGREVGRVYPRRDYYYASQQPMTIPGVRSTLDEDVYVLLVGWEPVADDGATFKVYLNPLVNLMWSGALVFLLGTLLAAWPDAAEERRAAGVPDRRGLRRTSEV